jgi:hypothetical protein
MYRKFAAALLLCIALTPSLEADPRGKDKPNPNGETFTDLVTPRDSGNAKAQGANTALVWAIAIGSSLVIALGIGKLVSDLRKSRTSEATKQPWQL